MRNLVCKVVKNYLLAVCFEEDAPINVFEKKQTRVFKNERTLALGSCAVFPMHITSAYVA